MNRPAVHTRRRLLGVTVVLLAGGVTTACDDGTSTDPPSTTESPVPDADAYAAALATVLDEPASSDEDRTVVFVVPLDDGVDIETQAAVIDRFAEGHDIRFVDDLAAAVEPDDPEHPPREDGMVVGIGTIASEPPHLVRLERYRAAGAVDASLLTLDLDADGWTVVTTEPVPAEVLVDAL